MAMTPESDADASIVNGLTASTQHLPVPGAAPSGEAPTYEQKTQKTESRGAGKINIRRMRRLRYALPGAWTALVFVCLSFTPSLLPRTWLVQGAVCGINGAIGYGLGVAGAWIWRAFADREARPARQSSWRLFFLAAAIALPVAFGLGLWWQRQVREPMGAGSVIGGLLPLLPLVAAAVFAVIVAVSRLLRAAYLWVSDLLGRRIGPRAARLLGWAIVLTTTVLLVNGVLLQGLTSLADRTFAVRDKITKAGSVQPANGLRSGGPQSLVSWDSLGREGRAFVGTGPHARAIAELTGRPAQEPIRAYAGTSSASDAESRARLAVEDLGRAGGFARAALLVATTTGSGWVDPASVDTFEYLTGGNSAIVAMQYSHLPSWISYLVDQDKAREAGRELFDAVYDRWSQLPADRRPKLYVFGESLGSFGGETAFSGEYDLRNRTSGVLFAGPPNFNTLYREFTDDRDRGSPEVQPVYKNGRTVRFSNDPGRGIGPTSAPWQGARVVYVLNPSDPIVWWGPHLALHRPDWLKESPSRDVLGAMRWIPFVTFWQVTADLPFATAVPTGHGHTYTNEYVTTWTAVLRPTGWNEQQYARLQTIITSE